MKWNTMYKPEDIIICKPTDIIRYEPADIIIHIQGKGIVVKEKSLIAFRKNDDKIVAIGTEAEAAVWRETENVVVMSPFRQGTIEDYVLAEKLLSLFRWNSLSGNFRINTRMSIRNLKLQSALQKTNRSAT